MATWIEVTYQCSSCGALDHDKILAEGTPVAPRVNCWNCHSGSGKDMGQMIQGNTGMALVIPGVESGLANQAQV